MKKVLGLSLLILLFGCASASSGKYTKASQKALRQSVTLYVSGMYVEKSSATFIVATGAGVWISPNGHILTCAHLFNFQQDIALVLFEDYWGNLEPAEILYVSKRHDLALLRALDYKNTYFARLANPFKVVTGLEVLVVGNPLGLSFTVTNGIVSATNRDIGWNYNMIQSNAAVNPGNSGGGVFNLKGELVGITSFMFSPTPKYPVFTGLGFSVASSEIIRFLGKFTGIYKAIKPRR
jgi:S1-C subfamily serine protease